MNDSLYSWIAESLICEQCLYKSWIVESDITIVEVRMIACMRV